MILDELLNQVEDNNQEEKDKLIKTQERVNHKWKSFISLLDSLMLFEGDFSQDVTTRIHKFSQDVFFVGVKEDRSVSEYIVESDEDIRIVTIVEDIMKVQEKNNKKKSLIEDKKQCLKSMHLYV